MAIYKLCYFIAFQVFLLLVRLCKNSWPESEKKHNNNSSMRNNKGIKCKIQTFKSMRGHNFCATQTVTHAQSDQHGYACVCVCVCKYNAIVPVVCAMVSLYLYGHILYCNVVINDILKTKGTYRRKNWLSIGNRFRSIYPTITPSKLSEWVCVFVSINVKVMGKLCTCQLSRSRWNICKIIQWTSINVVKVNAFGVLIFFN